MPRITPAIVAISGAALLATRLISPASSAPSSAGQPAAEAGEQVPGISDIDLEVNRLRERTTVPVGSSEPVRDPFRFGGVLAPSRPAEPRAAMAVSSPVVPDAPILPKLVAVIVPTTDGGSRRAAVLSVGDGVEVVTPGDVVMGFRVGAISDEAVTLLEPGTGSTYSLSLQ